MSCLTPSLFAIMLQMTPTPRHNPLPLFLKLEVKVWLLIVLHHEKLPAQSETTPRARSEIPFSLVRILCSSSFQILILFISLSVSLSHQHRDSSIFICYNLIVSNCCSHNAMWGGVSLHWTWLCFWFLCLNPFTSSCSVETLFTFTPGNNHNSCWKCYPNHLFAKATSNENICKLMKCP